MPFATNKCKVHSIITGRYSRIVSFELVLQGETIRRMKPKETFKYLEYKQSTTVNHTNIKKTH